VSVLSRQGKDEELLQQSGQGEKKKLRLCMIKDPSYGLEDERRPSSLFSFSRRVTGKARSFGNGNIVREVGLSLFSLDWAGDEK